MLIDKYEIITGVARGIFKTHLKKKTYVPSTNVSQLGFFVWAAIANIYNILLFYCMYLYVTLI